MAAGKATGNWANVAIERGIGYLLDTQRLMGVGMKHTLQGLAFRVISI
jgi:hypothetical protein